MNKIQQPFQSVLNGYGQEVVFFKWRESKIHSVAGCKKSYSQ